MKTLTNGRCLTPKETFMGGLIYHDSLVTKNSSFKTLTKNIVLAFLLLLLAVPSFAQTFTVENLKYTVTTTANNDGNGGEVKVAGYSGTVSGALNIPSDVTYDNITYRVTSIGEGAFGWCSSLTSITIPDGVTSIGNYAFSYCSGLISITIPDGVTSIGSSAFYNCTGLTSITIPDGVTSIGNGVFQGCRSLTSITIPDGVTSIGNNAFYGCTGVTDITFIRSESVSNLQIDNNAFYNLCNGVIFRVPTGKVNAYKTALNWVANGYSEIYYITDRADGAFVVTVNGIRYGVVDAASRTARVVSSSVSGDVTIEPSVSGFGSES